MDSLNLVADVWKITDSPTHQQQQMREKDTITYMCIVKIDSRGKVLLNFKITPTTQRYIYNAKCVCFQVGQKRVVINKYRLFIYK